MLTKDSTTTDDDSSSRKSGRRDSSSCSSSADMDESLRTMRRMERRSVANDLEGLSRLSTDAVKLTTQLVEAQHSRLDWFGKRLFKDRGEDKVRGPISAIVYGSIHAVNGVVGAGLGLAFSVFKPVLGDATPSKRKDAAIAVLNGVVGDYLEAEKNPLAISMQWRTSEGYLLDTDDKLQELWQESDSQNGRLLLLIHGSCNTPHDWWQEGINHGVALAETLDYTPLFLHYNTGLHISDNGKQLASAIDRLAGSYRQHQQKQQSSSNKNPLSLAIVAHSMGGLVSRSACYYAEHETEEYNTNQWLDQVGSFITLGSPHHGAILERGGKLVDAVLGAHPYTEPISWLGKIRSKGVTDLGYGNVRDEDWYGHTGPTDNRKPAPLPKLVRCLAIAAVLGDVNSSSNRMLGDNLRTDGLVTQASALGRGHSNPDLNLVFDEEITIYNQNHIGLLGSEEAYDAMLSFLLRQGPPGSHL
ncbi:PGAP1 family [Seminavis robusta]|uniref:GPI inositol-deacylase n=1 Tax=Seminavis robusta TaxID=568900 RepID=A0A9N8D6J3_9STRA|nr:PGAP1 family [Seminavis robusta]|eukprot:Sro19_g013380.1 PGAP1 family (472) ;mRNA; r:51085-52585